MAGIEFFWVLQQIGALNFSDSLFEVDNSIKAGNWLKIFWQNSCFSVYGAKILKNRSKMRFWKFHWELKYIGECAFYWNMSFIGEYFTLNYSILKVRFNFLFDDSEHIQ